MPWSRSSGDDSTMSAPRLLGHLLLWVGFLGGAFLAVRNPEVKENKWQTIHWPLYAIALSVGVVGVGLLRKTRRLDATHSGKVAANLRTLQQSLRALRDKLDTLLSQPERLDVFEIHAWIDAELMPEIGQFVESREALVHTCGLATYAAVMTDFSIGERNINRAWSASADGYVDEVWSCLERAAEKWQRVSERLEDASAV